MFADDASGTRQVGSDGLSVTLLARSETNRDEDRHLRNPVMLYRKFADGSAATASMASIALRFAPTLSGTERPPTALFSRSHFRVIPERNA